MEDSQLEQIIISEIKEYFDIIKIEKLTNIIATSAELLKPEHVDLMDRLLEKKLKDLINE